MIGKHGITRKVRYGLIALQWEAVEWMAEHGDSTSVELAEALDLSLTEMSFVLKSGVLAKRIGWELGPDDKVLYHSIVARTTAEKIGRTSGMGFKELGLYRKFLVNRTDEKDKPGEKHHGCEYLVLDLTHDGSALQTALKYADVVEKDGYKRLAEDLRSQVDRLTGMLCQCGTRFPVADLGDVEKRKGWGKAAVSGFPDKCPSCSGLGSTVDGHTIIRELPYFDGWCAIEAKIHVADATTKYASDIKDRMISLRAKSCGPELLNCHHALPIGPAVTPRFAFSVGSNAESVFAAIDAGLIESKPWIAFDTMDIYTQPGTGVIFAHPDNGSNNDVRLWKANGLTPGYVYVIESISVGGSHTSLSLAGFGHNRFNSVNFANVPEGYKGPSE